MMLRVSGFELFLCNRGLLEPEPCNKQPRRNAAVDAHLVFIITSRASVRHVAAGRRFVQLVI